MREDEFANPLPKKDVSYALAIVAGRLNYNVERVAIHSVAHADDYVGGGTVHAVPGRNHLTTWLQNVLH